MLGSAHSKPWMWYAWVIAELISPGLWGHPLQVRFGASSPIPMLWGGASLPKSESSGSIISGSVMSRASSGMALVLQYMVHHMVQHMVCMGLCGNMGNERQHRPPLQQDHRPGHGYQYRLSPDIIMALGSCSGLPDQHRPIINEVLRLQHSLRCWLRPWAVAWCLKITEAIDIKRDSGYDRATYFCNL